LHLERVFIDGVRNLTGQKLVLAPGANLFFGLNGSGKTSVLEAISLLATGRSFRTFSAKSLIQHESDQCLVQAHVQYSGARYNLGIQRHRSGAAVLRRDGVNVPSIADLASVLPTVLVDTASLELITGSPEGRRRYLDAVLFHVEQMFLESWRRYHRALRQRNAGLRRGTLAQDDVWINELAKTGEALSATRVSAIAKLAVIFSDLAPHLSDALSGIELSFRPGWSVEYDLRAALERSAVSDRKQGFTHAGPHRADIKITVGGRPAAEVLSRGQLKLAVLALKLAQGRLLTEARELTPVFLVDDIAAELDEHHAKRVCGMLAGSKSQVLLTAVERGDLERLWPAEPPLMFHVEQGAITCLLNGAR